MLEYSENITPEQLKIKLKYCRYPREFAAVVEQNKQHINMITDLLLQDPIHLQLNFIQSDDPCFFELLKEFPEHFQKEVNRHLLRWQDEKPHAFHFDAHIDKIIQDNKVALINPARISTADQDPVFT
jgi:hypothetical protein